MTTLRSSAFAYMYVSDIFFEMFFEGSLSQTTQRCDVLTEFGSAIGVAAECGRRWGARRRVAMNRVKTRVYVRNEKRADKRRQNLFPETVHMRNCTSLLSVRGRPSCLCGRARCAPDVGATTGAGTRCSKLERYDCYSILIIHPVRCRRAFARGCFFSSFPLRAHL